MKADQNKEISYIAYNHANIPTRVRIGPGEIRFIYDALGNKWYKFSKDGAAEEAKGTAYIFGMQYEFKENNHIKYDWKLMFIGTDEGYVSAVYPDGIDNEFKFQYVYNHTDHLGNIRQNITKENGNLTVLREHNYYPFGLLHKGYNEEKEDLKYDKEQDFIFTVQAQAGRYKYKFQGQERQEDLDLGWDSFKYRNYDYAIGRFFNVDPLAAKYPYNSTYAFQENKLGLGRELEGLELEFFGWYDFVTFSDATRGFNLEGFEETNFGEQVPNINETSTESTPEVSPNTDLGAETETEPATTNTESPTSDTTTNDSNTGNANQNESQSTNNDNLRQLKKDRVKTGNDVERSKNQLDGLEKAQQAAKKFKKPGTKQNRIFSKDKSVQNFKHALKRLNGPIDWNDINDIYSTQPVSVEQQYQQQTQRLRDAIPQNKPVINPPQNPQQ